jgi:hypothetical protein
MTVARCVGPCTFVRRTVVLRARQIQENDQPGGSGDVYFGVGALRKAEFHPAGLCGNSFAVVATVARIRTRYRAKVSISSCSRTGAIHLHNRALMPSNGRAFTNI